MLCAHCKKWMRPTRPLAKFNLAVFLILIFGGLGLKFFYEPLSNQLGGDWTLILVLGFLFLLISAMTFFEISDVFFKKTTYKCKDCELTLNIQTTSAVKKVGVHCPGCGHETYKTQWEHPSSVRFLAAILGGLFILMVFASILTWLTHSDFWSRLVLLSFGAHVFVYFILDTVKKANSPFTGSGSLKKYQVCTHCGRKEKLKT